MTITLTRDVDVDEMLYGRVVDEEVRDDLVDASALFGLQELPEAVEAPDCELIDLGFLAWIFTAATQPAALGSPLSATARPNSWRRTAVGSNNSQPTLDSAPAGFFTIS
jgi:hypothetical protein